MTSEFRVLITCDLGADALDRFSRAPGFSIEVEKISDEATLAQAVPGFHGVVVRSNVRVTSAVLEAGRDLQVVGRAGIGVDNIDVEAATRAGVAVVNAPGGNVVTTAEHAVALLMSAARRIPQANASMKDNRWEKKRFLGRELRGKTLGVVGVGRVGSIVAELGQGLRMHVVAYDPYLTPERAKHLGVELTDLDGLLARSDFITLHTPLTAETRGIIGRDALSKVKPGVIIVNCSRGGVVDEAALLAAIEKGVVAGAALDVFEVEPPAPAPLYGRDEVVLTPHLGASTVEAQAGVAVEVAENLVAYLTTGSAPNAINAPQIPEEIRRRLLPFFDLAERMGLLAAQIAEGAPEQVRLLCRGEAAAEGSALVSASFLKGLLTPALSGRVNAVNAPAIARQRGIRVVSSTTSEIQDFTDLVSVELVGTAGSHLLEGTLFGRSEPRIVRFDDYRIDALPRGNLIVIFNEDRPGVIGGVGTCLGRHAVNIAGMYNGRDAVGGRALTVVNTDEPASGEAIADLGSLPHVLSVKQLRL